MSFCSLVRIKQVRSKGFNGNSDLLMAGPPPLGLVKRCPFVTRAYGKNALEYRPSAKSELVLRVETRIARRQGGECC